MIAVCPAGHASLAQDYCDVCGLPIDSANAPSAAAPPPVSVSQRAGRQACPNCGADNSVDALFCENCGYDFTTGTMPRSLVAPHAARCTLRESIVAGIDLSRPADWQRRPGSRRRSAG